MIFPARWSRCAPLLTMVLVASACEKKPATPAADTTVTTPTQTTATTVPTILTIRCAINQSAPPQLMVDAGGEVPTGGWTAPVLAPRIYTTPPADGIYEYDFTAIPPSGGMVPQVLTPIAASHTWPDYPAATLKGVRIYGIGAGTKEATLTACNTP